MSGEDSDSERSEDSTLNTESMLRKRKEEIEFTGWKPTSEQLRILEWHYQQRHYPLSVIFNQLKVYGHVKYKNIGRWFAWKRYVSGHAPVSPTLHSISQEDMDSQISISSNCSNEMLEEECSSHQRSSEAV